MRIWALPILLLILSLAAQAQVPSRADSLKGSIGPDRAWWNVLHYELDLSIDIDRKHLSGSNVITFEVLETDHTGRMQIDLQSPLIIDSVIYKGRKLSFEREETAWFVNVPPSITDGKVKVFYSGEPKESVKAPYDGGIVWEKDSLGRDWISVACQLVGGSVWYPCKDHYSEEPDKGVDIRITINKPLVVISNGRFAGLEIKDTVRTFTWKVKSPINNYGVTFYIGNYVRYYTRYGGLDGPLDMYYWVLDYNLPKVRSHLEGEVNNTLKALEHWWGPYPFYEDGFKIVESSYIGMEHQSAIAYGNKFRKGRFGFNLKNQLHKETDRLVVHELAHEWFGNNITMGDIADRWVQEGFAAYAEELVMESLFGREKAKEFFVTRRSNYIKNEEPLISPYGIFKDAGGDNYFKGWAILHMLREIVNEDEKFRSMMNDLNHEFRSKTPESKDLELFISEYLEVDLKLFFDHYLRRASLPVLEMRKKGRTFSCRFTNVESGFKLPVSFVGDSVFRMEITTDWNSIKLKSRKVEVNVDPSYLLEVRNAK